MEIKLNESSGMQELLARLLQVLTPLVKGDEEKEISSLSRRLFIPPAPSERESSFRYPVRLLPVLQQAQKQMGHWIERFSSEKENPRSQSQEKSPALEPNKPKHSPQETQRLAERKDLTPLQGQARQLIAQVRQAIQLLSTASNLQEDSKQAPFREAIKKLKPLIDDLIETVGRGDMHSADDDDALPPRKSVRIAIHQRLLRKQIPLPFRERTMTPPKERSEQLRQQPTEKRPVEKREERGGDISRKSEPQSTSSKEQPIQVHETKPRFSTPKQGIQEEKAPFPPPPFAPKPPSSVTPPFPFGGRPLPSDEGEPMKSSPRFDRISLPGAPYFPQATSSNPIKAKKKGKNFWERQPEEDDEKSPGH